MRLVVGVVAVLVVGPLLAAPATGRACINSTYGSIEGVHNAVRGAEELVVRGRHEQAVKSLRRVFRDDALAIKGAWGNDQRLLARGQQALALAVARSRGRVTLGPGLGGPRRTQQDAAIAWAIAAMRWHLSGNVDSTQVSCVAGKCRGIDDPERSAILAELLALRTEGRAEALEILQQLGNDDLMPSAQAWAVLAALQRERGEADAAERAATRCRRIAGETGSCSFTLAVG